MTGLVIDQRFLDHVPTSENPERVDRMRVLLEWAKEIERDPRLVRIEPRLATREEIEAVHDPSHFDAVAKTAGQKLSILDYDTSTSELSFQTALLAAGGCIALVDAILDEGVQNGIALVRPPGHHAERNRVMGFCLFNNVAVAAAHARRRGMERVLIVDWDVHHGNGTQEIFEDDPAVFFVSLHQWPLYPGTGAKEEIGRGKGTGFTWNIPLPAGCGDEEYLAQMKKVVARGKEFAPHLVLVSAGFDPSYADPLGGMRITTQGFARMADELLELARETSEGRIAAFLEGGYDLTALRDSTDAVMNQFLEEGARSPS
jgi:acetoin utilization deacetylase AcuC-like enzyme